MDEYRDFYAKAQVKESKIIENRANLIKFYLPRYESVSKKTGVPWPVIGCIHSLEAGCMMNRHLHNGDPLISRTTHYPSGRPKDGPSDGSLPYSWEESAVDALLGHPYLEAAWEGLPYALDYMERYNGLGYRYKHMPSPYLWSCTDVYISGHYTSDGVFNMSAISQQIGAVALLKTLGIGVDNFSKVSNLFRG